MTGEPRLTDAAIRLTSDQLHVIESLHKGEVIRIGPDSDLTIIGTGFVEAYIETKRGLFTGLRLTPAGRTLAAARYGEKE